MSIRCRLARTSCPKRLILNEAEYNVVKSRGKQAAHPEQVNSIERMTKALEEL